MESEKHHRRGYFFPFSKSFRVTSYSNSPMSPSCRRSFLVCQTWESRVWQATVHPGGQGLNSFKSCEGFFMLGTKDLVGCVMLTSLCWIWKKNTNIISIVFCISSKNYIMAKITRNPTLFPNHREPICLQTFPCRIGNFLRPMDHPSTGGRPEVDQRLVLVGWTPGKCFSWPLNPAVCHAP